MFMPDWPGTLPFCGAATLAGGKWLRRVRVRRSPAPRLRPSSRGASPPTARSTPTISLPRPTSISRPADRAVQRHRRPHAIAAGDRPGAALRPIARVMGRGWSPCCS